MRDTNAQIARREQRMERRRGAPRAKGQHPEQVRRLAAQILQHERALAAHLMWVSGGGEAAKAAFWAVVE